ncbi:MAG: CehA/McbA family metallohydrolase, partial [Proteobacteria bacterium]|nr:CehA/McbA family metallohydrolase [Pseudomonadota bacterium]
TGVLSFTVEDETGILVPAKVSIFRLDGQPNRDPILGDGFIAGSPEAVVFPMYGEGVVELRPGTYQAIASRGLEYEIDISDAFTINTNQGEFLQLQVVRSIETDGWISADLHVHAEPSHDSGMSLANRVRSMVCEGVEFFAGTDHDVIIDYAPTVELLGMENWVQTAVGTETTTLEIGHFLAFPLAVDFIDVAGGAMDWTDMTPDDIFAGLVQQGQDAGHDPFYWVAHPRDGILGYYDQYGFDPYTGTILTPTLSMLNPLLTAGAFSWDYHGVECLNAKRFELIRTPTQAELDDFSAGGTTDIYDMITRTLEEQEDLENGIYRLGYGHEGTVDDWFSFLNLGFRYTAMGNSDTHSFTSTEAGCPRNYIMSNADDPAFIDDQFIADAMRNHQAVASYGPFVRMWIEGVPIGGDVVPEGGTFYVEVEVQAPSWMGVDRIELYENGTLVGESAIAQGEGPLYVLETFERTPVEDAWYVAIVMGDSDLGPVFTPVEIPYIELQMVITEALGGVESVSALLPSAVPIPREFPIRPFAITNPIWADLADDGFDHPGLPDWLLPPIKPSDE